MSPGQIRATWLAASAAGIVLAVGCDKSDPPSKGFEENVARTVGAPQESQGMFGGNSGPADAAAGTGAAPAPTALGDAGCSAATRGCGTVGAPAGGSDAGT